MRLVRVLVCSSVSSDCNGVLVVLISIEGSSVGPGVTSGGAGSSVSDCNGMLVVLMVIEGSSIGSGVTSGGTGESTGPTGDTGPLPGLLIKSATVFSSSFKRSSKAMMKDKRSGRPPMPSWIFSMSSLIALAAVGEAEGTVAVMGIVLAGSCLAACRCNGLRWACRARAVCVSKNKMQRKILVPMVLRGDIVAALEKLLIAVLICLSAHHHRVQPTYVDVHIGGCRKNGGGNEDGECMDGGAGIGM